MKQDPNQRVFYLDLLRVFATFAVIFLHVCGSELLAASPSRNWYIEVAGSGLGRWCVPVFVMISGALFLVPSRKVTYREILTIRLSRLLIAYVFWTVVYYFVFGYQGEFSIRGLMLSHFHLWFLPMLMGVYLLIPFLRNIAKNNMMMHYALAIWLFYIFVSSFQFLTAIKMMEHFYPLFNMNIVVGYCGYFLLGYFLSQHPFLKRQRLLMYLLGVGSVLITIFGTYYLSNTKGEEDSRLFSNLSIQTIVISTAVLLVAKELAPKCGKAIMNAVGFVRKDLFGIYLIHALWIPVVDTNMFRHCCSEIITLPLITIIVFVLSLFTTKLIRLVPILRKVVE